MATRKGATKTVGGKRYRYNGTKWVQVTNNKVSTAKVTSSSRRSTRSTDKPTTSSNSRNTSGSASNRVTYGQKQLPSKTSANSKAAKGQRLNTARTQQANQSNVFSQALKKTLAQRTALDKAETAAQGTRGSGTNTGTRTKGGPIVKSSGGKVVPSRGGAVVRSPGGALANTNSTGQRALPPGTKGGAVTGSNRPRRRNVNSNAPSSGTRTGRGGLPPKLRGVLETRGILPPASTPKGTSKPTDGRRAPTRRETATTKARQAAQGSRSSGVRTGGTRNPGVRRMGPLSGLVERGLTTALTPVAEWAGKKLADGAVSVLGTDEQKRKYFNKGVTAKGTGLRDVNGKPLPPARGAFNAVISSKVPQASTTTVKPSKAKDTPKPTPTRSTGSSGGGSGRSTVKPKPVPRKPQSKDMSANMKAWAKANPTLAAKVKKGQSGYDAIQSVVKGSKAKPAAKSTKAKPATSANAQNLRAGRSPDPTPKKKKKKKVLPYFGGNGIGRY